MLPKLPLFFDLYAVLILLGIGQGIFLAYLFFSGDRGHILSNRFLGWMLLAFSAVMAEVLLCYTHLAFDVLWMIDATDPINLAIPPIIFLYLYSNLNPRFRFKKRHGLHFLPFGLYLGYMAIAFFPQSEAYKYNAYVSSYELNLPLQPVTARFEDTGLMFLRNHHEIIDVVMIIQFIAYIAIAAYFLRKAFVQAQLPYFSNQNALLAWCRNMFLKIISVVVIFAIVRLIFHKSDLGDHIITAHLALVIYLISFQLVRQSTFFTTEITAENEPIEKQQPETPVTPIRKYEKSSLTEEIQVAILDNIEKMMREQRPYRHPHFSLPVLAKMLGVSPHHLSQVLNDQFKQNFFEFTAQYRIEEAMELLQDKQLEQVKIEEIAERVGYLSKSSFNTAFKKRTGKTPSEYRKNGLAA